VYNARVIVTGAGWRVQWLITGATGFVGTHLVQFLETAEAGASIVGTTLQPVPDRERVRFVECDLLQEARVEELIQSVQPAYVVHLAGQANVQAAFHTPWPTFEANLRPLIYLLEACRKLPTPPRILVITSAEVYGAVPADAMPITEQTPLNPANPYSVSKAAQDLLAQQYAMSYQMPIIRARPFNHIGPGQSEGFAATAFAMQIARIEAGLQPPQIRVGNLHTQRDFTDVRDIVRAYHLLITHGAAGEAYNIASGKSITIASLLDTLLALSKVKVEVIVDTDRLRPMDLSVLSASCDKLRRTTHWQPTYPLEQTLQDVLDDCRQRVKNQFMEKP
jgi:GDP-4-dehydro-6-deoxy-D-mannose reductase